MSKKVPLLLIVMFVFVLIFSCQQPVNDILTGAGADVSYSGDTVTGEVEAMAAFGNGMELSGMIISDFIANTDELNGLVPTPAATPAEGALKAGTRAVTVENNFNWDTFSGDVSILVDSTYSGTNAVDDSPWSASFNCDGSASLSHDITIDIENELISADNGSIDFDAGVEADFTIENVKKETSGGVVTLEQGTWNLSLVATADATALSGYLDPAATPPVSITSGTLSYYITPVVTLTFVISSTDPEIKGGKVVFILSLTRSKTGIDLKNVYDVFMELMESGEQPTIEQINNILAMVVDNAQSLGFTLKVYDNSNELVFAQTYTLGSVLSGEM